MTQISLQAGLCCLQLLWLFQNLSYCCLHRFSGSTETGNPVTLIATPFTLCAKMSLISENVEWIFKSEGTVTSPVMACYWNGKSAWGSSYRIIHFFGIASSASICSAPESSSKMQYPLQCKMSYLSYYDSDISTCPQMATAWTSHGVQER